MALALLVALFARLFTESMPSPRRNAISRCGAVPQKLPMLMMERATARNKARLASIMAGGTAETLTFR